MFGRAVELDVAGQRHAMAADEYGRWRNSRVSNAHDVIAYFRWGAHAFSADSSRRCPAADDREQHQRRNAKAL